MNKYKIKVPAGPIFSNDEAEEVGPSIAATHQGEFTGEWETIVTGEMSVIEIKYTF